MDLTPPALTRSPSTPSNTYCPSERSSLDYPSPLLVEQQYKIASLYGDQSCDLSTSMDPETSLPPLDSMGHPDWNSTMMHPASSASPMPGIMSGEYDMYRSYPYHHDVYHHPPTSHASPPPTSASRSPIPSTPRVALSYTPAPRIKMETSEYGQTIEVSHYPSPRSVHAQYPSDAGAYASTSGGYLSDGGSSGWHRSDYASVEPTDPQYYSGQPVSGPNSPYLQDSRRQQLRVPRPRRAPRRLTTQAEANFQCEVKGCGKLFSRSYNFKAHMETHDEKREYPFPCTVGDCNKKFVRKTDLQRHHQSVHMRERNHKCDYCSRLFARKDTLRRHMEDGCSKRFDLSTLELRADGYDSMGPSSSRPMDHQAYGPPSGGLPPMSIPPLGGGGLLAPMPPSLRDQHGWGR